MAESSERMPVARGAAIGSPLTAVAWLSALGLLSVAFRLPALVNAGTVDSDAAIVGLQARHLLQGEGSWFLWGSGYQTSVDSAVAALWFALFGPTSLGLVLSTLGGHIAATGMAFATLRRHAGDAVAFVLTLPLVFTSSPLHTYILNPPRQAALTLVFLAVFLTDGSARRVSRASRVAQQAAGAAAAALAVFADPYALLFLPALVLLGIAVGESPRGGRWRSVTARALPTVVGLLLGLVPFLLLFSSPRAVHGETTLTLAVLKHNAALLLDPCLPWLLGITAYVPQALLGYVAWEPGPLVHTIQRAGGFLFLLAIATGGVSLPRGRVPWPARRLGGFGFLVAVLTLGSFLVSVMVMDLFSSRYLAALVLASPFAILPLGIRHGARGLLLLLSPYLLAAGLCGWVGYGAEVRGPRVVTLAGHGAGDEQRLRELLRARGVAVAIADYWVSYRLTFLYEESIVVVPIHAKEDRYAPYRARFAAATKAAYVFDPSRSREDVAAMETEAFAGEHAWGAPVERVQAGALSAVIFTKRASD